MLARRSPSQVVPLLILLCVSARGDQLHPGVASSPFYGDKLPRLYGLAPPDRVAYCDANGLPESVWVPLLREAITHYVGAGGRPRDMRAGVMMFNLVRGIQLAALLERTDLAAELKHLVRAVPVSEQVTLTTLTALADLGTEDAFLAECLNSQDHALVGLAMMAACGRESQSLDAIINDLTERHGRTDPAIGSATARVREYRHVVEQLVTTTAADQQLEVLEFYIRRACPGEGDTIDLVDRNRGGSPAVRWSIKRWAELSRDNPAVAVRFLRESPRVNFALAGRPNSYRARLLALSPPEVRAAFPAPIEPSSARRP